MNKRQPRIINRTNPLPEKRVHYLRKKSCEPVLGPASLKRRARSLNADLLIESRPGRGTGLKFRVPLQ